MNQGFKTREGHLARRGYATLEGFGVDRTIFDFRSMSREEELLALVFFGQDSGVSTYFDRCQSDAKCSSGVTRRNSREEIPRDRTSRTSKGYQWNQNGTVSETTTGVFEVTSCRRKQSIVTEVIQMSDLTHQR
jgi:hypothetical protein